MNLVLHSQSRAFHRLPLPASTQHADATAVCPTVSAAATHSAAAAANAAAPNAPPSRWWPNDAAAAAVSRCRCRTSAASSAAAAVAQSSAAAAAAAAAAADAHAAAAAIADPDSDADAGAPAPQQCGQFWGDGRWGVVGTAPDTQSAVPCVVAVVEAAVDHSACIRS